MRYVLVALGLLCMMASVATAQTDGDDVVQRIEKTRARHKIWGALAYSVRKMPHGDDVVVTGIFLNRKDQAAVQTLALDDCLAQNAGSTCVAISFPGCFYIAVGRSPITGSEAAKTVYALAKGRKGPDVLSRQCSEKGLICTPPMGGCNYTNEKRENGFLFSDQPIPESNDWLSASKVN